MLTGTMTRTFKQFDIRIAVLGDDLTAHVIYEGKAVAMSLSKTDARQMARDNGVDVPRGAAVFIAETGSVVYEWDLQEIEPMARIAE